MKSSKLKIIVCHYREMYVQNTNEIYYNIQCGKNSNSLDLGIQGDDIGKNISGRNRYWSEITGLYWAWKNMERCDYVGLCSYRRFFNFKKVGGAPVKMIPIVHANKEISKIDLSNFTEIFKKYDVIVPTPYTYAYSISQVCSKNYVDSDFKLLEKTIHEISPDYDSAFKKIFFGTNKLSGHNMFVLQWDLFQKFCEWVFSILLSIEKKIDPSNYPNNQVRVFGYMHEILLGVFIERHGLRKYESQIIWINDKKYFKFNNMIYRILATVYFHVRKIL